jgi:hypothetical protein
VAVPSSDAAPPDAGSPLDAEGAEDWVTAEPPLGGATRAMLATLARRARRSWRVWVPVAVLLAGLVTARKARQAQTYSVTVVLRAVEGVVSGVRSDITIGQLRTDIEARAFTTERLVALMRRHGKTFPDAVDDPGTAIAAFRDALGILRTRAPST